MTIRDRTAIVGVGSTPYFKRGRSAPQTLDELVGKAILAALDDCGMQPPDIDGFAYFAGGFDTPAIMEMLGIPEVRFTAGLTGTGGGSAGAIGLAAAAIVAGEAEVVVCVGGQQQADVRYGSITSHYPQTPANAFFLSAGLVGPGHMFALLARRHMHLYGTTRAQFAEVALSIRENALKNPRALMQKPLTAEDYFAAPLIADPHCLYDFCLESDGVIACIVTTAERAHDLRQRPAYVLSAAHGGSSDWGRSIYWMNMPDETFASSGHTSVARRLFDIAEVDPADIDCAQIYDHFTSQVIMQLEDYGFCEKGEGGAFVESGAIRFDGGTLPVNTDGGQLSCGYVWGMTHVLEAVEQIRGIAVNQIADAELVLVTGGPSVVPVSGLILRR